MTGTIILISGRSGSGKSEVAKQLLNYLPAVAIVRLTSRPIRPDDDPRLIAKKEEYQPKPGDLVSRVFGNTYVFSNEEIEKAVNEHRFILLDGFNAFEDLIILKKFKKILVVIDRPEVDEHLITIYKNRHMLKDEIEIRLEAIEWSKNLHQKHKEQADVIIKNVGTLSDLSSNIRNFADMLISKPDYSRPNQ